MKSVIARSTRFRPYIRNFVFGVEDSLVSTVGLLSGVAVAGASTTTIILTGVVLIFVEGFSMGVGSLLSQHAEDEYLVQHEVPLRKNYLASIVMFISYVVAGVVPLLPYFLLAPIAALPVSIILSLVALFLLGAASARFSNTSSTREGVEMLLVGGAAILLGTFVGIIVETIW